jgi:hypothetical protein
VQTEYWVGIHEDIWFLGRDWLTDLVAVMERESDLDLLEGEKFRENPGMAEPVSGEIVDLQESLSTWLFCVRTSLRDRLDSVFQYWVDPEPSPNGRKRLYDIGGKLLRDMRGRDLRFAYMPWWFRLKWHHWMALSWSREVKGNPAYAGLKAYQRGVIAQLLTRYYPASRA